MIKSLPRVTLWSYFNNNRSCGTLGSVNTERKRKFNGCLFNEDNPDRSLDSRLLYEKHVGEHEHAPVNDPNVTLRHTLRVYVHVFNSG